MFTGFLLQFGGYVVPIKYIKADTYTVTRNVQDLDSYRDANGVLHRNALDHVPIKVEFETIPMNNVQLEDFFTNMSAQYANPLERNALAVIYIPETNDYVTQEVYMSQPVPKMKFIDFSRNLIQYDQLRLSFIGY